MLAANSCYLCDLRVKVSFICQSLHMFYVSALWAITHIIHYTINRAVGLLNKQIEILCGQSNSHQHTSIDRRKWWLLDLYLNGKIITNIAEVSYRNDTECQSAAASWHTVILSYIKGISSYCKYNFLRRSCEGVQPLPEAHATVWLSFVPTLFLGWGSPPVLSPGSLHHKCIYPALMKK